MEKTGKIKLFYIGDTDPVLNDVAKDLKPFFDALIREVARHVPRKGYGYRNAGYQEAFAHAAMDLAVTYSNSRVNGKSDNPGEALDAAAMLAFSWLHETGNFGPCITCANPDDCQLGCPTHIRKGSLEGPKILGRGDPI